MIEMKGATISRGNRVVLQDANLSISDGVTALLGPNGAGKTTLIRALIGFQKLDKGEVLLDGRPIAAHSAKERARRIAYVPQISRTDLSVSAAYFVAMGAYARLGWFGSPSRQKLARAEEILSDMELSHLARRRTDELSGGEARLLYLARARMQDAEYLFLDEPTASLDFARAHRFLERLKREGRRALVSLHDPTLALQYADRVALICDGVVREGATQDSLRLVYGRELELVSARGREIAIWRGSEP